MSRFGNEEQREMGKRKNLGDKTVFKTLQQFFLLAKGGFQSFVLIAIIHEPTTFTIKNKAKAMKVSLPGKLM